MAVQTEEKDPLGLYRLLQCDPADLSMEPIHKNYKKLALKYHPDINKSPDAHRLMAAINEAYEILGNPVKRLIYDKPHLAQQEAKPKKAKADRVDINIRVEVDDLRKHHEPPRPKPQPKPTVPAPRPYEERFSFAAYVRVFLAALATILPASLMIAYRFPIQRMFGDGYAGNFWIPVGIEAGFFLLFFPLAFWRNNLVTPGYVVGTTLLVLEAAHWFYEGMMHHGWFFLVAGSLYLLTALTVVALYSTKMALGERIIQVALILAAIHVVFCIEGW